MVIRPGALRLGDGGHLDAGREMQSSGEDEAMGDVLARRAVIAGPERIQRVADAVHIVKKFAEHASPGFRLRERVVRDQIEAMGNVALQMHHQRVVARAVVGLEKIEVGNNVSLIGAIVRIDAGMSGVNRLVPPVKL